MNRIIFILAGVLVVGSAVAGEITFRCFTSVGTKKPIRIQFEFQAAGEDVGYVKYATGSGPIRVKRLSERELKRASNGKPSTFETSWLELVPSRAGGTYLIVSQGAMISEFKYIRPDGKAFRFQEDFDAPGDESCEWPIKQK